MQRAGAADFEVADLADRAQQDVLDQVVGVGEVTRRPRQAAAHPAAEGAEVTRHQAIERLLVALPDSVDQFPRRLQRGLRLEHGWILAERCAAVRSGGRERFRCHAAVLPVARHLGRPGPGGVIGPGLRRRAGHRHEPVDFRHARCSRARPPASGDRLSGRRRRASTGQPDHLGPGPRLGHRRADRRGEGCASAILWRRRDRSAGRDHHVRRAVQPDRDDPRGLLGSARAEWLRACVVLLRGTTSRATWRSGPIAPWSSGRASRQPRKWLLTSAPTGVATKASTSAAASN